MQRYIYLFAVCWLAHTASLAQNPQATISLSVHEAVSLALENNADVAAATEQIRRAEFQVREARGNFLPRLALTGNYTRNIDKSVIFLPESLGMGGATEIGADNNFNAYLDLSVPLYSRYNVSARNYAQENFHFQREQLRQAQQTITNNVKKAYFACLLSAETIRVRERALANADDNYILIVQKVAQGVATEYDETSARVRASFFRADLLEARDRRVPAENTLKLLLGLSPEAVLLLTDSLYLDEQELTFIPDARELTNNSTLRQKEHRLQISQGEIDMTRSAYYPVLSGAGTYQYQSQQNDFRFSQYQWVLSSAVSLRLQVPLFNGMITRNRVQQHVISAGIARIELNYICGYNEAKFGELVSRLGYLKERIAVQADNIQLADKTVMLVRERYRYGKSSLLEINSAELDLVTARLSYLQSIADYKSSYSDLLILTGNENP